MSNYLTILYLNYRLEIQLIVVKGKIMSSTNSICPVCDAQVLIADGTEVTELVSCPDCSTSLVVESIVDDEVTLAVAPEIEEDWGE